MSAFYTHAETILRELGKRYTTRYFAAKYNYKKETAKNPLIYAIEGTGFDSLPVSSGFITSLSAFTFTAGR